jgi:glycosyltransferase involved in cell wall biosynthesis
VKILISSIACAPFGGSEGIYGWRACRALADRHEIWVLTSAENSAAIRRAGEKGMVPDSMHFAFVGDSNSYHANRLVARLQSWLRNVAFNRALMTTARPLHASIGFDLAHHITYTTWRVGCRLWKLGIPLVWGPISGTEIFPFRFLTSLSFQAKCFELVRRAAGLDSRLSPSVNACARRARMVLAAHTQARRYLARLGAARFDSEDICYIFWDSKEIEILRRDPVSSPPNGTLTCLASGNLEGRKGIALALHALAASKRRGVRFTYKITSRGPEMQHLTRLAAKLGLQAEVSIGNVLDRSGYITALKDSDVYLLPSLREGGGTSLMEAMLAGCVPIVADCGGPGQIVTDECGYRITVTTQAEMIGRMADTICHLDRNRDLLLSQGGASAKRIADHYTQEKWLARVEAAYLHALPG